MTQSLPGHDDQQRLTAAMNLATGGGDPTAEELLQQRKISAIRRRIVLVLGSVVIGAAVGWSAGNHGFSALRGSRVAHWRTVAGPVLLVAGLVLEIVVIVARFRSGQVRTGWRSPSLVLSRPQRRQLIRQIRGRAVVDEQMLPVTRRVAELLLRQRSIVGLFIALPMVFLGQALPRNDPFHWWLAILLIVVYALLSIPLLRDSARAQRFLAQNPAPR